MHHTKIIEEKSYSESVFFGWAKNARAVINKSHYSTIVC